MTRRVHIFSHAIGYTRERALRDQYNNTQNCPCATGIEGDMGIALAELSFDQLPSISGRIGIATRGSSLSTQQAMSSVAIGALSWCSVLQRNSLILRHRERPARVLWAEYDSPVVSKDSDSASPTGSPAIAHRISVPVSRC